MDAAAFALLKEGRNPTVSLVRERMGGASPNVVAPALQRWRLTFAAQLQDNSASALEVLPPGVLELVQALWSRALFEAHRVQADVPSSAQALDRLNAAIADLRELAARLQEREKQVDGQLRELDRQRQGLAQAGATMARRRSPKRTPMPRAKRRRAATIVAVAPRESRSRGKQTGKSVSKLAHTRALKRSDIARRR